VCNNGTVSKAHRSIDRKVGIIYLCFGRTGVVPYMLNNFERAKVGAEDHSFSSFLAELYIGDDPDFADDMKDFIQIFLYHPPRLP